MILFLVLVVFEVVALIGAVRLARREREHRLVVLLVAYALVDEVMIEALHRFLFTDPDHPLRVALERYGWPARAGYHLETALFLGWPALLCAIAWSVFALLARARRARDLIFAAWLGAVVALVALFPLPVGWTKPTLHALEGLAVVAALAAVPGAWRRRWSSAHVALLLLVAIELTVATIGPFVRDPYRNWHLARLGYVIGFAALAGYQALELRRPLRDVVP